jgi:hypothetical protein
MAGAVFPMTLVVIVGGLSLWNTKPMAASQLRFS